MLRERVMTALIMAGLFLLAIAYLPLSGLALFFGVLICLGAWEWSGLSGWQSAAARVLYVMLVGLLLVLLYRLGGLGDTPRPEQIQPLLGVACLWWSFALLWIKGYPDSAVLWRARITRSVMGLLILAPGWLSAVYLLSHPRGGVLMLVLVLVVAAADIGAYFAGKKFGRRKLAERVSPAKTWEGFWGGVVACALLAGALWYLLPFGFGHVGLISVLVVVTVTGLASVIGDLTVSMVKRESGVKNTGSLLPGHGGVLDRLDSLCGAAPVFALGLLLVGW
ncbi:MAG: phosphatidate cytidylyltransferase [Halioglobus sp.]|nr:phosphatidate cytidylyltransferase [Halioglobus sp.]